MRVIFFCLFFAVIFLGRYWTVRRRRIKSAQRILGKTMPDFREFEPVNFLRAKEAQPFGSMH